MEQGAAEDAVSSLGGMLDSIRETLFAKADDIVLALVVLLVSWMIAKLVRKIISDVAPRVKADTAAVRIVARLVFVAIIIAGIVLALGTAGVNWTALATSLGLTGFALGFALKDAISNFLSGLLILFYRPFNIGDRVKVSNVTGVVKDIRVRDTVIITDEELKTIIPNSSVFNSIIVNYTESEVSHGTGSADSK